MIHHHTLKSSTSFGPTLLAVVAVGILTQRSVVHAQAPSQIEDVTKVWETRQAAVKSLRVEWTEEVTVARGSVSKQVPRKGSTEVTPPVDFTYRNPVTLLLDGEKIYYRYLHRQWESSKQGFVDNEMAGSFDGVTVRMFTGTGVSHYPYGLIPNEDYLSDVTGHRLRPHLITFRATDPKAGPYRGMPFRLTGRKALIGAQVCPEVQALTPGPDTNLLWVDPAREYSVVRLMRLEKNVVRARMDIKYRQEENRLWTPAGWETVTYLRDGSMHYTVRATVAICLLNPEIPPEAFQIAWPAATYVRNLKTGEEFIQKENGETRIVPKNERSLPYDVLATTPGPYRFARLFSWPTLAFALVIVASGGCMLTRYLRRRRRMAHV